MTVSSPIGRAGPYAGDGATRDFPVGFVFLADDHLNVALRDRFGAERRLTRGVDYAVAGAGSPNGGAVSLAVAPAVGESLTIIRDLPTTQEVDYPEGGRFPAKTHERALDQLTMKLQQVEEQLGRTALVQVNSGAVDLRLPDPAAGRPIGWSGDGADALVNLEVLGTWRGDWTTATRYVVPDGVRDPATGDLYFCVRAHDSAVFADDLAAGHWDLAVDLGAATTAATQAADARDAAALAQTNAEAARGDALAASIAAAGAATNAAAAEDAANAAAGLASDWASALEDVEVAPGAFSARHHAAKAAASAAAAAAVGPAATPTDRIILAVGQSNMVGSGAPDGGADETIDIPHPQILAFPSPASGAGQVGVLRMEGPGFTSPFSPPARYYSPAFSYCLSRIGELNPGERFIVVQCALVGTALGTGAYWDPTASNGGFQDVDDALRAVAAAFPDAEPEAILWCQGEANAATTKATYKTDLAAGIARMRANARWSSAPFLMLSVVPGHAAATPGLSDIDDAQRETALEVANTAFIRGGFGANTSGHYLTGEQRANGRRLADALRRLPRFDSAVPATPPLPTIADANLTVTSPEGAQEFTIEYRENGTAGAFTRIDSLETADPIAPGLRVTLDIGALPSAVAQEVRVAGRNRAGTGGFSPSAFYQPAAFQSPTVNMDPQNAGSTAASIVDSANSGSWASEGAAGGSLVTVDGFQQANVGLDDVYAYSALQNALASGNVTISMLFLQTGDAFGPGTNDSFLLGSTSGSIVNNLIMRTALQPGRQDEPHFFERNTRLFLARAHFTQRTYQALTVSVDRSAGVGGTGIARMYLSKLAGIEETFTLDTPTTSYRPRTGVALITQQNQGRGLPMRIGAIRLFDNVLTPAQVALLHNSYESEFGITLGTAALLP